MQAPQSTTAAGKRPHIAGPLFRHSAHPLQPLAAKCPSPPAEQPGIAQGPGLAHDAGNLLSALGLYSDLLGQPGVLLPEHAHYAVELRQIAERSVRLMQQLIPRIPAAATPQTPCSNHLLPHPVSSHPAVVVRDLEPLLRAIAAPHAVVSLKIPRTLPEADFAAEDLERILVNLVRNSAQAIERSRNAGSNLLGQIRIALSTSENRLNLSVEDDGPGMPVFSAAAFLSPSPLPAGAGRGLGHRIIHELVTGTGGTLSVRVRPGRGTSFLIQWPVDYRVTGPSATPASLSDAGFQEVSAC